MSECPLCKRPSCEGTHVRECDHKWAAWTEPNERTSQAISEVGMYTTTTFWTQWRECKKCGKAEMRYVEVVNG